MAREVICATTDPTGPNDCRCITEIGYVYKYIDSTGSKTPEEVHNDIKHNDKDYYVEYRGSETDLIAAEKNGTKYVRTERNDTENDNLLKLNDC
jgi:uncharacterized membrane protein